MFFSLILAMTSSNLFLFWAGMELLTMSILLIMGNGQLTSKTKESMMMFFVVQSLGGMLLYYSVSVSLLNSWTIGPWLVFLASLLLKLGVTPFYYWLNPVIQGAPSGSAIMSILVVKKLPIIVILAKLSIPVIFCGLSILTGFQGAFMGLNMTSLSGVLVSSSLGNMGWLIYSISTNNVVLFFGVYSICIMMIMIGKELKDASILFYFLSLSSIPPFMLFWPKLKICVGLMNLNLFAVLSLLLATSVISLTFYLKYSVSLSKSVNALNLGGALMYIGLGSFLILSMIYL